MLGLFVPKREAKTVLEVVVNKKLRCERELQHQGNIRLCPERRPCSVELGTSELDVPPRRFLPGSAWVGVVICLCAFDSGARECFFLSLLTRERIK